MLEVGERTTKPGVILILSYPRVGVDIHKTSKQIQNAEGSLKLVSPKTLQHSNQMS